MEIMQPMLCILIPVPMAPASFLRLPECRDGLMPKMLNSYCIQMHCSFRITIVMKTRLFTVYHGI